MDEWRLNSRAMAAGGFKWRADEYYARGHNKPKHMYSPDWQDIEVENYARAARPQGPPAHINPLKGHPPPKPQYGFLMATNPMSPTGTQQLFSPTASQLGFTLTRRPVNGLQDSMRRSPSCTQDLLQGAVAPNSLNGASPAAAMGWMKQSPSSQARATTPPGLYRSDRAPQARSMTHLPTPEKSIWPSARPPQQVVQAWG
eukprot:TRINITY_DN24618_c0_g1_i1.p1 TRINITY_DN24618_c0_g1~~TRINITY_DN24618_c0_g1_i1.p1  ORF type:complete len:200 (-),score=23.84 TRINITY_DN24618_c0_g1_i1:113-712(-)